MAHPLRAFAYVRPRLSIGTSATLSPLPVWKLLHLRSAEHLSKESSTCHCAEACILPRVCFGIQRFWTTHLYGKGYSTEYKTAARVYRSIATAKKKAHRHHMSAALKTIGQYEQ